MIAVGPGAPNKEGRVVPTAVKAGDRVLLPGWGGNAIKVGEDVRLLFFPFFFRLPSWLIGSLCRNSSSLRIRRFWPRLRSRVPSTFMRMSGRGVELRLRGGAFLSFGDAPGKGGIEKFVVYFSSSWV